MAQIPRVGVRIRISWRVGAQKEYPVVGLEPDAHGFHA